MTIKSRFIITFKNKSYSDPLPIQEIAEMSENDILEIDRIDHYHEESDIDHLALASERKYD